MRRALALTPIDAKLTPRQAAAVNERIEVRVGARSMALWNLQFPDITTGTVGLCVSYRGETSNGD